MSYIKLAVFCQFTSTHTLKPHHRIISCILKCDRFLHLKKICCINVAIFLRNTTSWSGNSKQIRMVSECGPMHPLGCRLNQGH